MFLLLSWGLITGVSIFGYFISLLKFDLPLDLEDFNLNLENPSLSNVYITLSITLFKALSQKASSNFPFILVEFFAFLRALASLLAYNKSFLF